LSSTFTLCLSLSHGSCPDLHSFPTRRSSDLEEVVHIPDELDVGVVGIRTGQPEECLGHMAGHQRDHLLGEPDDRFVRGAVEGVKDRKSTRLNSSHVKISYAVFCLKKKTLHR